MVTMNRANLGYRRRKISTVMAGENSQKTLGVAEKNRPTLANGKVQIANPWI